MTTEGWHSVSKFESHDYVRSWYEEEHGRPPGSAKIQQITSFFAQGHALFRSAASADMSAKPLLLYYGVLALARGVILLKREDRKEESLKKRHGLEIVNWDDTLGSRSGGILKLGIRSTSGTFDELVNSCPNTHHSTHSFRGIGAISSEYYLGPIRFSSDGTVFTLDDLLSRIKRTEKECERTTGRGSNWFQAVFTYDRGAAHFALPKPGDPTNLEVLSQNRSCEVGQRHADVSGYLTTVPTLIFKYKEGALHDHPFPMFYHEYGSSVVDVVPDFGNGDALNEFYKIYLTSYILGMLCRYFPSKWMTILRGGPGDFAKPLLEQAIDVIENDFPKELSRQVPEHPNSS